MRRVLIVFFMIAAVVPSITAQSKNGTLIGSVQDLAKNLVPGVGITITNAATKETHKALTNEAGEFKVTVPAGTYIITAKIPGFKMATMPGVIVKENESTILEPIKLTLDVPASTAPIPGIYAPLPLAPVVPPSSNRI